jgi:hypothetical protein
MTTPQQGLSKPQVEAAKKSAARRGATYFAAFVCVAVVLNLVRTGPANPASMGLLAGIIALFVAPIFDMALDAITRKKSD